MACVTEYSFLWICIFNHPLTKHERLVKFIKLKYILLNYHVGFIAIMYYLGQDVNRSKNKVLDAYKSS